MVAFAVICGVVWPLCEGEMPTSQGSPENLNDDKMSIAVSASYNAEAEFLTSSDTRVGVEFAWIKNRWYVAAEGTI